MAWLPIVVGIIIGYMIYQKRINDARNRIDQVIDQVQQTVWSLKRRAMS